MCESEPHLDAGHHASMHDASFPKGEGYGERELPQVLHVAGRQLLQPPTVRRRPTLVRF